MSFGSNAHRRSLVFLTAGAMVAGLGVVVTTNAVAVEPCGSHVSSLTLESTQRFASGGRLKRYSAKVQYPDGGTGTWRDQTAKVLFTKYPSTAYPSLLFANIGNRVKTGTMVKAQAPQAVGAINGDFYVTPTIRGEVLEISRGPMVKNGRIIRAGHGLQRVVGVDTTNQPFAGELGV